MCPPYGDKAIPDLAIEDMELSVRVYHALLWLKIKTLAELAACTPGQLLKTPNFGRKSLNEVKEVLAGVYGLGLADQCARCSAADCSCLQDRATKAGRAELRRKEKLLAKAKYKVGDLVTAHYVTHHYVTGRIAETFVDDDLRYQVDYFDDKKRTWMRFTEDQISEKTAGPPEAPIPFLEGDFSALRREGDHWHCVWDVQRALKKDPEARVVSATLASETEPRTLTRVTVEGLSEPCFYSEPMKMLYTAKNVYVKLTPDGKPEVEVPPQEYPHERNIFAMPHTFR